MTDAKFPKSARLLTKAEFDRVFAQRASVADDVLVVYAADAEVDKPRLGLVVSRKVGNAVARNRWKRVLREAFRLVQHELPKCDYVCLPRARVEPDLAAVDRSLRQLAQRASRKLRRC